MARSEQEMFYVVSSLNSNDYKILNAKEYSIRDMANLTFRFVAKTIKKCEEFIEFFRNWGVEYDSSRKN